MGAVVKGHTEEGSILINAAANANLTDANGTTAYIMQLCSKAI